MGYATNLLHVDKNICCRKTHSRSSNSEMPLMSACRLLLLLLEAVGGIILWRYDSKQDINHIFIRPTAASAANAKPPVGGLAVVL